MSPGSRQARVRSDTIMAASPWHPLREAPESGQSGRTSRWPGAGIIPVGVGVVIDPTWLRQRIWSDTSSPRSHPAWCGWPRWPSSPPARDHCMTPPRDVRHRGIFGWAWTTKPAQNWSSTPSTGTGMDNTRRRQVGAPLPTRGKPLHISCAHLSRRHRRAASLLRPDRQRHQARLNHMIPVEYAAALTARMPKPPNQEKRGRLNPAWRHRWWSSRMLVSRQQVASFRTNVDWGSGEVWVGTAT